MFMSPAQQKIPASRHAPSWLRFTAPEPPIITLHIRLTGIFLFSYKNFLFFFIRSHTKPERTAAAVTENIHQAKAQAKAVAACKGPDIAPPHITVPVAAVGELLLERTVLHIVRLHGTCLRDVLPSRHIVAGPGICHRTVIIPGRGTIFNV